jgi:deoxyribodipyrimidine photo-lyase
VRSAVVLFTRDLRVRDNPALHAASTAADQVVPLFVVDDRLATPANRQSFLSESLTDLRQSLRRLGADLVIRYGNPAREATRITREVGADRIELAADVGGYAADRQRRLVQACATHRLGLALHDATTLVPPGAVQPAGGGDHYRVFTPYWRAWQRYATRTELPIPRGLRCQRASTSVRRRPRPPAGPRTSRVAASRRPCIG